jgi:uncharacterized protein
MVAWRVSGHGESYVSPRKEVVERYFEWFRRSDHRQILACPTDDVAWDLPGYAHLTGKEAFDREIENDEFVGSPTLTVDRLIEGVGPRCSALLVIVSPRFS